MKLKPDTRYKNNDGNTVDIIGPAKVEPVEGQRIWWSLQGNHYSEDGRFVGHRRVRKHDKPGVDHYESFLLPAESRSSLKEEAP